MDKTAEAKKENMIKKMPQDKQLLYRVEQCEKSLVEIKRLLLEINGKIKKER